MSFNQNLPYEMSNIHKEELSTKFDLYNNQFWYKLNIYKWWGEVRLTQLIWKSFGCEKILRLVEIIMCGDRTQRTVQFVSVNIKSAVNRTTFLLFTMAFLLWASLRFYYSQRQNWPVLCVWSPHVIISLRLYLIMV